MVEEQSQDAYNRSKLALWVGVKPTVSRTGDQMDQLALSDIDRLAGLGVQTVRFPLLWEHAAPLSLAQADFRQVNPQARLIQTEDLGRVFSTPELAA